MALLSLLPLACSPHRFLQVEPPPTAFLPKETGNAGVLCVLRPRISVLTILVRDNGVLVGATRSESYFCWNATPGRHVIRAEAAPGLFAPGGVAPSRSEELVVTVSPRSHVYLLQDTSFDQTPEFELIDASTAREMADELSYEICLCENESAR